MGILNPARQTLPCPNLENAVRQSPPGTRAFPSKPAPTPHRKRHLQRRICHLRWRFPQRSQLQNHGKQTLPRPLLRRRNPKTSTASPRWLQLPKRLDHGLDCGRLNVTPPLSREEKCFIAIFLGIIAIFCQKSTKKR